MRSRRLYKHYKTQDVYELVGVGKRESDWDDMAYYVDVKDPEKVIINRPAAEFFGYVMPGSGAEASAVQPGAVRRFSPTTEEK